MRRNKPVDSKVRGSLPMVHPNAAAIDIGARMHVAAVGADRTVEPVPASAPSRPICIGWWIGSQMIVGGFSFQ